MAPNSEKEIPVKVDEKIVLNQEVEVELDRPAALPGPEYKIVLRWRNIIIFIILHTFSIISLFYLPKLWSTYIYQILLTGAIGFGTTCGSHRLFTHKSYVAKPFLRYILIYLQTLAGQEPIYRWVRDHRVHHKYTDTNADPHNSNRGFFFSHMGWLCCRKHPDVAKYGKRIDMSDLEDDKIIQFQRKIYLPASIVFSIIVPTLITMAFGEHWWEAMNFNILRYTFELHCVWLVNSGAHYWGTKPYEKNISATDTWFVAYFALGEGFHNYHHIFPWDYRTSETKAYWLNLSTMFIDLFAKLGLAHDLKAASPDMIRARVLRTGDGSHKYSKMEKEDIEKQLDNNNLPPKRDHDMFWGWGDGEMTEDDRKDVIISNREEETE